MIGKHSNSSQWVSHKQPKNVGAVFFRNPSTLNFSSVFHQTKPKTYKWSANLSKHINSKHFQLKLTPPSYETNNNASDSTLCRQISLFDSLSHFDICSSNWKYLWPEKCQRLIVLGLPKLKDEKKLMDLFKKLVFEYIDKINITLINFYFGNDLYFLNPLKTRKDSFSFDNLVIFEFLTEYEAKTIWTLCSANLLKIYGNVLSAIPDPSGYRIFGEAVAANFQEQELDNVQCFCCKDLTMDTVSKSDRLEHVLLLPFFSQAYTDDVLRHCFALRNFEVLWLEDIQCTIIKSKMSTLDHLCLPTRHEFVIAPSSDVRVKGGCFFLNKKITPCIFDPPQIPLSAEYLVLLMNRAQSNSCQNLADLETTKLEKSVLTIQENTPKLKKDLSRNQTSLKKLQSAEELYGAVSQRGSVAAKKRIKLQDSYLNVIVSDELSDKLQPNLSVSNDSNQNTASKQLESVSYPSAQQAANFGKFQIDSNENRSVAKRGRGRPRGSTKRKT